ncbi:MAG: divalent metal cation transporter [Nitrososphaerales archaeon]|nr:divalent metal cation transporter [Nitrososphaerales archaeon]
MADVDAPSVITAGESGAAFGYHLVFVLLILIVPLFFIQEASGRLGVTTGKGLAEVIKDNYSRRMAVLASLPMFITDFLSYTVEYAGIAVALEIFGVPPLVSLPAIFLVHASLVFTGSYRRTEKILLLVSAILLSSYILDAFLVKPDVGQLVAVGLSPFQPFSQPSFGYLIAANVGAVIMPWMLFYQAGAVAQKGLNRSHASHERLETLLGAIASEVLMVAIVIVSASIGSVDYLSPSSLAKAFVPLAGEYAYLIYGLGLGSAAFLGLVVVSLASTWGIAEALGWRRRIGEKFSLARNFYLVYLLETLPAVFIPLIFTNLVNLMLTLMVIFVFVTIVPAVMLGVICSNKVVMGANVMGPKWRLMYWSMLALVVLTGILTIPALLG